MDGNNQNPGTLSPVWQYKRLGGWKGLPNEVLVNIYSHMPSAELLRLIFEFDVKDKKDARDYAFALRTLLQRTDSEAMSACEKLVREWNRELNQANYNLTIFKTESKKQWLIGVLVKHLRNPIASSSYRQILQLVILKLKFGEKSKILTQLYIDHIFNLVIKLGDSHLGSFFDYVKSDAWRNLIGIYGGELSEKQRDDILTHLLEMKVDVMYFSYKSKSELLISLLTHLSIDQQIRMINSIVDRSTLAKSMTTWHYNDEDYFKLILTLIPHFNKSVSPTLIDKAFDLFISTISKQSEPRIYNEVGDLFLMFYSMLKPEQKTALVNRLVERLSAKTKMNNNDVYIAKLMLEIIKDVTGDERIRMINAMQKLLKSSTLGSTYNDYYRADFFLSHALATLKPYLNEEDYIVIMEERVAQLKSSSSAERTVARIALRILIPLVDDDMRNQIVEQLIIRDKDQHSNFSGYEQLCYIVNLLNADQRIEVVNQVNELIRSSSPQVPRQIHLLITRLASYLNDDQKSSLRDSLGQVHTVSSDSDAHALACHALGMSFFGRSLPLHLHAVAQQLGLPPVAEQPVVQQPVAQQPVPQQPVVEWLSPQELTEHYSSILNVHHDKELKKKEIQTLIMNAREGGAEHRRAIIRALIQSHNLKGNADVLTHILDAVKSILAEFSDANSEDISFTLKYQANMIVSTYVEGCVIALYKNIMPCVAEPLPPLCSAAISVNSGFTSSNQSMNDLIAQGEKLDDAIKQATSTDFAGRFPKAYSTLLEQVNVENRQSSTQKPGKPS